MIGVFCVSMMFMLSECVLMISLWWFGWIEGKMKWLFWLVVVWSLLRCRIMLLSGLFVLVESRIIFLVRLVDLCCVSEGVGSGMW